MNACILWIEKIYVEYDTEIEVVTWKNRKEFVNKRGKKEELVGGKKGKKFMMNICSNGCRIHVKVCLRQERGRTKIQYVECM